VTDWPALGTSPHAPTFRPDGAQVALRGRVGGKDTLLGCDVSTGEVKAALPHPDRISDAHWHPPGRMIVTCCNDHRARLWDRSTWEQTLVLEGPPRGGAVCRFTPDGDRLLGNDWGSLLRVWDVHSGRLLFRTPLSAAMHHFGPDGRLALQDGTEVKLIRLALGRELRALPRRSAGPGAYHHSPSDVVLSPDGRLLAVRTADGACALV